MTAPSGVWRRLRAVGGPWVLAVVLVGALLRVAPMVAQLPFTHNPDESRSIIAVAAMVEQRTTDTTVYSYPALMFNVEAAALTLWDATIGDADTPIEFSSPGATRSVNTGAIVVMRVVALLASCVNILLAAALARRMSGRTAAALLAAALVAVNPLDVRLGATVTPDPFAGAFSTAALLAAVFLAERLSLRRAVVAGAMVGLAAASKFNAVLVSVGIAVAVAVQRPPLRRAAALLGAAGVAAVVAFALTSPQTIIDIDTYWFWFRREQGHYRNGHPGYEGGAAWYYLATIGRMVGPALLAVPVVIALDRRFRLRTAPVTIAAVAYIGVLATYVTRFDRNMLVLSGGLAALAAVAVVVGVAHIAADSRRAVAVASGLAFLLPAALTVRTLVRVEEDPWTAARNYILEVVPPGAQIVVESYGPWLPPEPLVVRGVLRAIDPTPRWYRDEQVGYLVTVDEVRNRYADADRYPVEHSAYVDLLAGTCVMKTFSSDEFDVEVRRVLPLDSSLSGNRPSDSLAAALGCGNIAES